MSVRTAGVCWELSCTSDITIRRSCLCTEPTETYIVFHLNPVMESRLVT